MSKACRYCGSPDHTGFYCKYRPNKLMRRTPFIKKGLTKKERADIATKQRWIKANPPDEYGYWDCYLRISQLCLYKLNRETLTIEHVIAKSRDSKKRHDLDNLRPSCLFCNRFKGTRSLESLAMDFPHLQALLPK